MDAHRSRSLGMAALIFILISLTAAVFHGAAPVRAEDVHTADPDCDQRRYGGRYGWAVCR